MTMATLIMITAPLVNIIQSGADAASSPAAISHANMYAKVALTKRARWDTLGLGCARGPLSNDRRRVAQITIRARRRS